MMGAILSDKLSLRKHHSLGLVLVFFIPAQIRPLLTSRPHTNNPLSYYVQVVRTTLLYITPVILSDFSFEGWDTCSITSQHMISLVRDFF
jgi:hypothetical protein